MMWLFICLSVLGLVVLLLWAPVWVSSSWDGAKQKTELRYLGMRLQIRKGKRPKKRKKRPKKPRKKSRFSRPGIVFDMLDHFAWKDFRAVPTFIRDILRHANLRVRHFEMCIATPDPALTGALAGWMEAVRACLPARWPIHLETSFDESAPKIRYDFEAKIRPVQPLWDLLHLAFRLPWRHLTKFWRKTR
jgi:hypothetical protein